MQCIGKGIEVRRSAVRGGVNLERSDRLKSVCRLQAADTRHLAGGAGNRVCFVVVGSVKFGIRHANDQLTFCGCQLTF